MKITLTKHQQDIADQVLVDSKQLIKLSGGAGTGKSIVVSWLFGKLKNATVLAPTGKACAVLQAKGIPAQTIHSAIYKLKKVKTQEMKILDHNDNVKVISCVKDLDFSIDYSLGKGVVIIDESSMVGSKLLSDIKNAGVKVILVGDGGQLPPINDINLMETSDYELTELHRFAGNIAYFAKHLRDGFEPSTYENLDESIRFVKSHKDWLDVDQIICGLNSTRVNINREVRKSRGYRGVVDIGEKLISLNNSHGLCNGSQIFVEESVGGKIVFFAEDGEKRKIVYHPDGFNSSRPPYIDRFENIHPFDYGYCVTCHKSQGSEWDSVLVIDQGKCFLNKKRGGSEEMVRKWRYTAATRTKQLLIWKS